MSSNGHDEIAAAAERRPKNQSAIDLDRRILDDNVAAAIAAAERMTLLAKQKLREQGLAPAASSGGGLSGIEIKAVAKGMVNYLRNGFAPELMEKFIKPELAALAGRIAELEQHIAEREGKLKEEIATLKAELGEKTAYRRVWKADARYRLNDEVTFKGQTWQCNYETTDKPGTSGAWTLKHKREHL